MIYSLFLCIIVQCVGIDGYVYDPMRYYSNIYNDMQHSYRAPASYFKYRAHNNNPLQSIFVQNWLPSDPMDELSMRQCGITPVANTFQRIVGGSPTDSHAYPWMVLLKTHIKETIYECGGMLITGRHVLTAAHCIVNPENPSNLKVHAAIHHRDDKGFIVPAKIITIHPRYSTKYYSTKYYSTKQPINDIAIITLQYSLPVSDPRIGTICLPPQNIYDNYLLVNSPAVATGWGCTKYNGCTSEVLRQVTVSILDARISECKNQMKYPSAQICAGKLEGGADACQGDSGGPLMIQTTNGRWQVIGITSFGDECGLPNKPGIYTRVSVYNDFIRWVITQSSHDPPIRSSSLFSSCSTAMYNRFILNIYVSVLAVIYYFM